MASDIVAFALCEYTPQERHRWITKDRDTVPKQKLLTVYNGDNSFNYHFMMRILELLVDIQPVDLSDLFDFKNDIKAFKNEYVANPCQVKTGKAKDKYIEYLKQTTKIDNGVAIPIAVAVMAYSMLVGLDDVFASELFLQFLADLEITEVNCSNSGLLLLNMCRGLMVTGYLSGKDIAELHDTHMMSLQCMNILEKLSTNCLDREFLNSPFLEDVTECSYSEILILRSILYTLRHWAYDDEHFKKLPKHQLVEVYLTTNPLDIAFVYTTIAMCSDHEYKLMSVNLMTTPGSERIEELLKYC